MSALPSSFEPSAPGASFPAQIGIGRWHSRRPDLLAATLDQVRRTTPAAGRIAEAILPRLPRRALASQNLRTVTAAPFSSTLPLDAAAACPWISFDSETHRNVLAFDLDHTEALECVEELPAHLRPWIMLDAYSGRAHAFIFLASPVSIGEGTSGKARRLADVAQAMMAAALRATPLRHRALLKNPLGRLDALLGQQLRRTPQPATPAIWEAWKAAGTGLVWHTVPGASPVELHAIIAALEDEHGEAAAQAPTRSRFRRRRPDPSATGRNCSLFDQVRCWAYDHHERDGGAILAEAMRVSSTFANPLPASEVAATARSITKFMWQRFRPRTGASSATRRDATAGAELATTEERQALAGRVTASARAAATDAKIAAAVARLRAAGSRMTQAAIAAEAGISLRTVKGRWVGIRAIPIMVQDASLSGSAPLSSQSPTMEDTAAAPDMIETGEPIGGMSDIGPSLRDWPQAIGSRAHGAASAKKTRECQAGDRRQRHLLLPIAGRPERVDPPLESEGWASGPPPIAPPPTHRPGQTPPRTRRAA